MKRKCLPEQGHNRDKKGYLWYAVECFDENLKLLLGISFILINLIKFI
jgi:hypothetical protein